MKERVAYIDIAKGLGMLAIIWGHICCRGWSNELVYSFHIPLFFFLSGIVYNEKKYNNIWPFIKNRAKRLLLPYLVYSLITWVFWVAFNYFTDRDVEGGILKPLMQTFIAQGSGGYLVHNVALWFIPCLFCVEIIYFFIGKLDNKGLRLIISCLLAGISIALEAKWGNCYLQCLPWNLDSALMAMPFYCVGNLIGINQYLYRRTRESKPMSFLVVLVLTIVLQWAALKWGAISMGHSFFGNEWIFHIRGLIGCISTLLFSMLLASILNKNLILDKIIYYVRWVGEKSLDFMATNNPLKGVICTFLAMALHIKVNDASFTDMGTSSIAFIITLIVDTILVWMIVYARKHHWFNGK